MGLRVRFKQRVEDAHTFRDPAEAAEKLHAIKADPSHALSVSAPQTDTGEVVEIYVIESYHPGDIAVLPGSQATKLLGFGYVELV